MTRITIWLLAGLALSAVAVILVFITGMRLKWAPVLDAVRAMNRRVINPRQLRSAGTPGAYASIIQHTGRRTGRVYLTPIVATPVDDGFVVALPYGTRSDWVRNVMAARSARLTREGREHLLSAPTLRPIADFPAAFSTSDDRAHRWFGVRECLHVVAEPPAAATPPA